MVELWAICITAFSAVFLLLTVLAGVMELITRAFPQGKPRTDSMVVAAVTSAVQSTIPGSRVVRIEEQR